MIARAMIGQLLLNSKWRTEAKVDEVRMPFLDFLESISALMSIRGVKFVLQAFINHLLMLGEFITEFIIRPSKREVSFNG